MTDRVVAMATPPEDRTRAQWAALGWPYGPPLFGNEAPPEVEALTPAQAYAYGWNACLNRTRPDATLNREASPEVACDD